MKRASDTGLDVVHSNRANLVSLGIRGNGLVLQQQSNITGADVRRQHIVQDGERNARLMAQARHKAVARIEIPTRSRIRRKRVILAVIPADSIAELAVKLGA